jgi:hypothetical protein
MPAQASLPFARRFELPAYRVSWREGAVTIVVEIGARCVDESWPHWHPWRPWD